MKMSEFNGNAQCIGFAYGKTFQDIIRNNVNSLVKRIGYDPLPLDNPVFLKWVDDQEKIISTNWPWLIKEMHAIADGSNQQYRDILFLNLRVWQYDSYSDSKNTACSSMVITLSDGTIANVGALDDNNDLYCGMLKIVPDSGYSYFTFPIAGTCWGNRGINSAGLCVGSSSQIIKGLKRKPGSICGDIANRVILQTCATVNEVREFCKKNPFTLNLVCSDKNGDIFSAHQTTAELFELSDMAPFAITNHVVEDNIIYRLEKNGALEFKESFTTRLRRGRLLDFISIRDKKCLAEEVREYISERMDGAACSICPTNNIVLTYANPQIEPGLYWVAEPQNNGNEKWISHTLEAKLENDPNESI